MGTTLTSRFDVFPSATDHWGNAGVHIVGFSPHIDNDVGSAESNIIDELLIIAIVFNNE